MCKSKEQFSTIGASQNSRRLRHQKVEDDEVIKKETRFWSCFEQIKFSSCT